MSGLDDAEEFIRFVAEASAPVAIPIREIEEESAADPEISQLQEGISTGDWDKAPPQCKHVRNELSSLGKLVLRGMRLLIPRKLPERVLDLAHEGHQGLVKTKQKLRTKVWGLELTSKWKTGVRPAMAANYCLHHQNLYGLQSFQGNPGLI